MAMKRFSQRYGYTPIEKAIVRECMPEEVINSLCTAFDIVREVLHGDGWYKTDRYKDMEQTLWLRFLNKRLADFTRGNYYQAVATSVLKDQYVGFEDWYLKLDMVEMAVRYLINTYGEDNRNHNLPEIFIEFVNKEFERHGYAYRIVDNNIVEITSKEEIESIVAAKSDSNDLVRNHLDNAISAYAKRPIGDYVNSIKESISAVEALCREKTGEQTLGAAVKALEKKNLLSLPKVMKEGLDKIYAYTNQPSTGIRHALMEADGKYIPGSDEARYMLVVCSAFINYLNAKFK